MCSTWRLLQHAAAAAVVLAGLLQHTAAAVHAAAVEPVPEWACSPPSTRNPYCPVHLHGDTACTETFCPARAGCASADCNPLQGNLAASKLLALDAYAVKGERCIRQAFSLAECCSLCKSTRGCNAWSYCNSPVGCGSGCDPRAHGFSWQTLPQPWNDVDPERHPQRLNPIHACTPDGGFPWGTCSLKLLDAGLLTAPTLQPGNQTGWVSGLLVPAGVDPVAFVLEQDGSGKAVKRAGGGATAGGLLEEDATAAPRARAAAGGPGGVEVPINTPRVAPNNAAGAVSSWRTLAAGCLLALTLHLAVAGCL